MCVVNIKILSQFRDRDLNLERDQEFSILSIVSIFFNDFSYFDTSQTLSGLLYFRLITNNLQMKHLSQIILICDIELNGPT